MQTDFYNFSQQIYNFKQYQSQSLILFFNTLQLSYVQTLIASLSTFIKLLFPMFKFLEGRHDQSISRHSITKKPNIAFGLSLEAAITFQNATSMVSPKTYINPFIDMEQQYNKYSKRTKAPPEWIHKTNISLIQQGKVIGSGDLTSRPDRYHQVYKQELQKNTTRFRHTRGQFTDYLQRNSRTNEIFGPLVGEQRSAEKSLQTKRSILMQSHLHLQKSKQKLELNKSLRKQSSKLLQKIIDEKREVRHKRQEFLNHYKQELTQRKSPPKHYFTLPRILKVKEAKNESKHRDFGLFKTIDSSMLSSFMR